MAIGAEEIVSHNYSVLDLILFISELHVEAMPYIFKWQQ